MTLRIIFVIHMQSTLVGLEDHICVAMLGMVNDEVITVVADLVFPLDLGQ